MVRKWLSRIRKEKKMLQRDVAEKVGINAQYYAQIEQGLRTPSVEKAQKIAEVLGFDWTIFFTNKCSEKRQNENSA